MRRYQELEFYGLRDVPAQWSACEAVPLIYTFWNLEPESIQTYRGCSWGAGSRKTWDKG